jgi:hypothetical protein
MLFVKILVSVVVMMVMMVMMVVMVVKLTIVLFPNARFAER